MPKNFFYNDKWLSLKELLEKDSLVPIHQRNVKVLTIEMCKVSNNFSRIHMNEIFKIRNKHPSNLRQNFSVFLVYNKISSLQNFPKLQKTQVTTYKVFPI